MQYRLLILLVLFLICCQSRAQTEYLDSIYSQVERSTHDYVAGEDTVLRFDYYVPEGDLAERPLVVYVHGGGFSGGTRDDDRIVTFANRLAARGYAVVSVTYRLKMKGIGFGCDVPAQTKIETFDGVSLDISRAIEVILNDPGTFPIDKDKVVLAGSSAGAEAILNLAYVYENPVLPADFTFAGVISMAGAVTTVEKISGQRAVPAQLFHGTGDQLVPYGIASHHYCFRGNEGHLILYGSRPIAERLKGLGVAYYLYAEQGGNHSWAGRPMWECFDAIVDFLYHDVVEVSSLRQTERILVRNKE